MTRSEFLNRLKHSLGNDLNTAQVQDYVDYYDSYIRGEMSKGRSETDVVDELGDPWALAKNISRAEISKGNAKSGSGSTGTGHTYEGNPEKGDGSHNFSLDTRWKRILAVVVVVVAALIVLSLFSAIFRVLSPVLIVVMIVLMLARVIQQRRR